jgi:hypothetical protein
MELQVYILGLRVWAWAFELNPIETSTSDPKPQALTQTNKQKNSTLMKQMTICVWKRTLKHFSWETSPCLLVELSPKT